MTLRGYDKVRLRRTAGFSLIELLIVVAIIAALVGVAVPMFQKNIQEAHRAKAQQDLDTIRNAITLHDSQNKPLIGTDLKPLLGRYLQELPKDPWGNDYLLDAGMGVLISFGGDQKAGGTDEDEDLRIRYKSVLKIQKVIYTGSWGLPAAGATMRIQFNKPYVCANTATAMSELVVVLDNKSNATIPFSGGSIAADPATSTPIPTALSGAGWGATTWAWDSSSDGNAGLVVLKASGTPTTDDKTIRLNPSYSVNIKRSVEGTATTSSGETLSTCSITEKATDGGPCDRKVFGDEVLGANGAHPQELIGGENRGVAIERTR